MYCRECGKPLLESDKFCSNCGTPVKKIVPAEEPMFRTEEKPSRAKTAPLPKYTSPALAEEPKGERMIFEAIGDSIKWDTDIFPDKTPKKTEDVDFHWNLSEDEFRNRPAAAARAGLEDRSEPSLWSGMSGTAAPEKKSTGLKPSDTNSWDELFEGTRQDDRHTSKASGATRSSIETYWEDMFRRDGAVQREQTEKPQHRISISRDDITRGIGDEGAERLDQNKLEETMSLSRSEVEGAIRKERNEKTETRENREVAELASLAAAGIGAGPTFVPEGADAVTLPEDNESSPAEVAEEQHEITGAELEEELFRDMQEPMTEAQKMRARQTEKIDKFYTFNKKNEEFQKLLDQEYERFKKSREEDDLAADLYKLGDENFFEDFSREGNSQAEEMARARQSMFHTDELAVLRGLMKDESDAPEEAPAEDAAAAVEEALPEEPETPAEEPAMPAEEPEAPAEEPAKEPAGREKKQKKSLFGRLFGRNDDEEPEPEELPAEDETEEAAVAAAEAPAEEAAETAPAEEEAPADEAAEEEPGEPEQASIVFEPEEEPAPLPPAEEPAEEAEEPPQPEEETVAEIPAEEPAPEEPAAEEAAGEEPEEESDVDLTKTASIVFEPEADEPIVHAEPEEPEEEPEKPEEGAVARTTEPTRIYEKGDIPTPTTEEERATEFEESRAEAWDAFFSDDEDINAGNTFDAEADDDVAEKHGASVAVSILAIILVILLALIVIRLALPDSIISIKLDQITEKILHLFNSGAAGAWLHHIM